MGINVDQLRDLVILPTLECLNSGGIGYSTVAEDMLVMIAAHESKMGHYIRQVGCDDGVGAYGIYQIELATELDAWDNYINYRVNLRESMLQFISRGKDDVVRALTSDLSYQTAIARIILYRAPEKLPEKGDYIGMAKYCKKYWNTELGKATWEDYLDAYKEYHR